MPLKAQAFALQDVRLLDGPFKHAMELDRQYLLSLEPDRLLHTFRVNAGLPSAAKPLGGWEEPKCEVRGHFVGHYLTACALMYASTGDERLKEKGNAVVAGLAECQAKMGSGYLSAYPEEFFDRVEAQKPVWAPYYTLHKIYAGLIDMYVYCDNQQALEICKKFADWVIARNGKLTDEQMQKMLGNEHGGMNETLANLYGVTGEEKYLKIAQRFNHLAVIGPASKREDKLTGLHANTQIPKFVGTARQYELTGDRVAEDGVEFFWDTVVKERSYVIGGHSDGEHFSPKEKLSQALGPSTTETCNTYNMLKLTRHLFCWDPQAEYADYYERALYNHILASQNPETGMMCYYVPLRSGSRKDYNGPLDSFWCCTGTGVENHAKYGDSIYFHDEQSLYVNLFIASELNWKARGLKAAAGDTVPGRGHHPLDAHLRGAGRAEPPHPASVVGDVGLGDSRQRREGIRRQPARQLRDGGTDVEDRRHGGSRDAVHAAHRRLPRQPAPVRLPARPAGAVRGGRRGKTVPGDRRRTRAGCWPVSSRWPDKPSTFTGPADVFRIAGDKDGRGVTLEPFYKMHGNRHYVVYWDVFTPAQWQTKEEEYAAELARQKELDARTVDSVNPGEEQNERDHKLQGERTAPATSAAANGVTPPGGWFSWELKVLPDQAQELRVTYWGSDGGRVFDVLVDGEKLATQRLNNNRPDQFYDEVHPLPEKLTKARSTSRSSSRPIPATPRAACSVCGPCG